MKDATRLLLDRIISWEKNLSEYDSLESILREQFVILDRKEVDNVFDAPLPYDENDMESVKNYLRSEGLDPEAIAEQGVVFVNTVIKNIRTEKRNSDLLAALVEARDSLQGAIEIKGLWNPELPLNEEHIGEYEALNTMENKFTETLEKINKLFEL